MAAKKRREGMTKAQKAVAAKRRQDTLRTPVKTRKKVAAEFRAGRAAWDVGEAYGVSQGTVRAWAERYAAPVDADPLQLPTEPEKTASRRKALPLKATAYACPHCGGPIAAT